MKKQPEPPPAEPNATSSAKTDAPRSPETPAPVLDISALTAAIDDMVAKRVDAAMSEIQEGLKQIGRFIPPDTLAVALKAPAVNDDIMLIDQNDMVLSFHVRLDGPGGAVIAQVRSSVALPEILAAESLPPCLETLESTMLQSIVGPTKAKLGRFVSDLVSRRNKASQPAGGYAGAQNYGPALPSEVAPLSESDLGSQAFQVYRPPAGGDNPPPPLSEDEAMEAGYRASDDEP